MAINSPAASSIMNASVKFDRSPPTTYTPRFMQDYVFNARGASSFVEMGKALQSLPEEGGLFGITLRPLQEHQDNFIHGKETNSATGAGTESIPLTLDKVWPDSGGIVKKLLGNPSSGTQDTQQKKLRFFGWRIIESFYKEYNSSSGLIRALYYNESTEQNASSTSPLSDDERLQRQGAKWKYRKITVEDGKTKLVPYQEQLQGPNNGPSGIGVHWGIQKYVDLPHRVGFVLDFYVNKDINLPSKTQTTTAMPDLRNSSGSGTLVQNYAYFNTTAPTGWTNSSIFTGPPTDANNFFNFIGKAYLMIEIHRHTATGDHFFLVMRSDANPRLYQIKTGTTDNKVLLLGEYSPASQKTSGIPVGLAMLRGRDKHLRIMVRNLYGSIIIDNNVFNEPWVITVPVFEATPTTNLSATNNPPSRTSAVRTHIASIGGKLRVYGGNISCGVSYSPVTYPESGSLNLSNVRVFGTGRTMGTYLTSFGGANDMPNIIKTGTDFYTNSARLMTRKLNGSIQSTKTIGAYGAGSTPSNRRDVLTAGTGILGDVKTQIITEDTTTNIGARVGGAAVNNHTQLATKIELKSGDVTVCHTHSGTFETWNLGKTLTPVLQYARQMATKRASSPTRTPVEIKDLVMSMEITKQAEELHVVRTTGSLNINIHKSTVNTTALNSVVNSIGKARYLQITMKNPCTNLNVGHSTTTDKLFTGIAFNPTVQEQAGKRHLRFDLKDYWVVLESKLMYNSPFFDGALDKDVITYLVEFSGMDVTAANIHPTSNDAMPISFSFAEPLSKFDDGKPISDHIKQLAKRYSKFAYFDAAGDFRYEPIPSVILPTTGAISWSPTYWFYSTHLRPETNSDPSIRPIQPQQTATSGTTAVTGTLSDDPQIAYEVKTTQWNMTDIVNKMLLQSVDARNRGHILVADTNFDSLTDPNSVGYLGFEKAWVQQEAAMGDIGRVKKIMRYYSRMYRPPYTITWKTRGGNLKPDIFDLVAIDDRMVVLNKITHRIDASQNLWETEYTGEWIWHPLSSFNPTLNT